MFECYAKLSNEVEGDKKSLSQTDQDDNGTVEGRGTKKEKR